MTTIPGFAASHSRRAAYHRVHQQMLKKGQELNGTHLDDRAHLSNNTEFKMDNLDVYTDYKKQQVVIVEKLTGGDIDDTYIDRDFQTELNRQVYRTVMKPNKWGVLEVRERVDTRSEGGEVDSWQRMVESDASSGGFLIYNP